MIIDFHTHAFPDEMVEKVMRRMTSMSTCLRPKIDGTFKALKIQMSVCEIDKSVVLPITVEASQQRFVNDFIKSHEGPGVIPFGSVSPWAPDAFEELERLKEMGVKGIKFHPAYQRFFVDDEQLKPLYKKISELGLITVFHAGEDFGSPSPYLATPKSLAKAVKWIDSPVVCTHWGGFCMGDDVLKYLCDAPVYFDTALGFGSMPKSKIEDIIEAKGIDYILFGSDTPWQTPAWDIEMITTLNITDEERDKIYYKNAAKLLGIE